MRSLVHRTIGNPTAKAAIDMALWDITGQAVDRPVTHLLGGCTDRMRVSHMLGFDAPGKTADEALRMRESHGITTFKVKVGRHPVHLDLDVCRAIREAVGETAELYVDGDRGWTASEAAAALPEFDELGMTLVEELCPADDVLGRRWLVRQCRVPFVADESATTPAEATRALLGGDATTISTFGCSRSAATRTARSSPSASRPPSCCARLSRR